MSLGEFIVSEFWIILIIVSMLLIKSYRIPGMLVLMNKVSGGTLSPLFLLIMVMAGSLIESNIISDKFLNKQKRIKRD